MIDPDVELGTGVVIFDRQLVNIFGCSIGDGTFIGPFVEITRGVKIGRRCKIESHSFVCDGVELADGVFIGHGVMFTNDLYPTTYRQVKRLSTFVGEGASLGSNATVHRRHSHRQPCRDRGGRRRHHPYPRLLHRRGKSRSRRANVHECRGGESLHREPTTRSRSGRRCLLKQGDQ